MKRDAFEARVLSLWSTTRVPLTRANLLVATGAPRAKLEHWLDAMVVDGVLEIDSDDAGELFYTVPGATRPRSGATSAGELIKLEALGRDAKALTRVAQTAGALVVPEGKKSIGASTALSFFLGPVGWLYAAPLREAVPGIVVFTLLYKLLPSFLFLPLLGILLPLSAVAGAAYAWMHNQSGDRTSLGDATKRIKGR